MNKSIYKINYNDLKMRLFRNKVVKNDKDNCYLII